MRHDIIKTDNYLLVVDDSDIKEKSSDWFYSFETNKIYDAKTFHTTVSCKKIIAHLPLNPPFIYGYTNSPILEGMDLLPPLEDDIESIIDNELERLGYDCTGDKTADFVDGFVRGYEYKAKYKYTEEDVKKAFEYGKTLEPFDSFDDFIQSLQQPKMPVAFNCITFDSGNDKVDGTHILEIRKTTNSQGLTQWVGEYIY